MPLQQQGIVNHGSTIDRKIEQQIDKVFKILDQKVSDLSKAKGLLPAQVKLLQPLHQCILVGDVSIFVVLSLHDLGGVSTEQFVDWSGKPMNMETAIFLVERDLGFKDAFGFQFSRSVLDYEDDDKETPVAQIAERYIDEEIANIERQR